MSDKLEEEVNERSGVSRRQFLSASGAALAAVAATGATGLGDWVARLAFPQTRGIWACIGGVLALSLLELIPLLGMVVFAIGLIVSIGASVVTRFGSREVSEPVHAVN